MKQVLRAAQHASHTFPGETRRGACEVVRRCPVSGNWHLAETEPMNLTNYLCTPRLLQHESGFAAGGKRMEELCITPRTCPEQVR